MTSRQPVVAEKAFAAAPATRMNELPSWGA